MKDSDIIQQATVGNKGAYRELLRKYSNLALAVAYARSGNKESAQAAAADTFVEGSKELAHLPESAPIPPWLSSITRTITARHMQGRRRPSFTQEAAKEKIGKTVEEAGGPNSLDANAKNGLAMIAFNALSDEERESLCILHTYSNNYKDIASAMAVEVSKVDEYIATARNNLATLLKPLFTQSF